MDLLGSPLVDVSLSISSVSSIPDQFSIAVVWRRYRRQYRQGRLSESIRTSRRPPIISDICVHSHLYALMSSGGNSQSRTIWAVARIIIRAGTPCAPPATGRQILLRVDQPLSVHYSNRTRETL